MPHEPYLSIVVPLFDEEPNVRPLVAAVRAALDAQPRRWELVLVDDGSRDGTLAAAVSEAGGDARVRVLALARNAGQTTALAAGFARARGSVVVSMDGDLQNDPRDIPRMVERIEAGAELVCGWRRRRHDALLSRKLPSRIANRLIARLTGVAIHDNGCTLKAFRAEVVRSLHLYSEMHRFLPAYSAMTGARIEELEVRHHPRRLGKTKYGLSRTFRVLGDMVVAKMLTQFASRPGRWFLLLALPWAVSTLLAAGISIVGPWRGSEPTVIFAGCSLAFGYLTGHMLVLALLSELILLHADREPLRRAIEALARELPLARAAR